MPDLTDEELVETLREKGHEQAAIALERKLSGQRIVAANAPPPPPHDEISHASARARTERGFAQRPPGWDVYKQRRNKATPEKDGGEDGE